MDGAREILNAAVTRFNAANPEKAIKPQAIADAEKVLPPLASGQLVHLPNADEKYVARVVNWTGTK